MAEFTAGQDAWHYQTEATEVVLWRPALFLRGMAAKQSALPLQAAVPRDLGTSLAAWFVF